ncbi:MAG: asparagine synthase (glutamine-hydrolyzing), partial [Myxococcota bacterium]|nr:asparagine synthase (glutamine-hydrolyzing) [Myxococcota bacterium]
GHPVAVRGGARDALGRMNDPIPHRGPDEDGLWVGRGVGLAARRLSIIDVAASHQPQFGPSGKTVCVFNGEVYNFAELRSELEAAGHVLKTQGDTEILPHGYEEWGIEGLLERLNGMFGFALYDGRSKELFVARDRLGIKPMYVGQFGTTWVFGSELKSLLQHPEVRREIDPDSLARYLMMEYVPSPRCIYRNIEKIEPGHYLHLKPNGSAQRISYWQLEWGGGPEGWNHSELGLPSQNDWHRDSAWQEALIHALQDAIRLRLVSEVPIGALLSGGVDSSAISALMAEMVPDLRTFSIAFEEESFDESSFSSAVAKHIGSRHTSRTFTPSRFSEILDSVRHFIDEPFADASILPTHFLSRTVKEEGVTVVLSGDGADELFGGYPTYVAQRVALGLDRIPGSKLAMGGLERLSGLMPSSYDNISNDYKLRRFLAGARLPAHRRQVTWLGSFLEDEMHQVLSPEVRSQLAAQGPWTEVDRLDDQAARQGAGDIEKQMHLDLRTYMGDDILVKVDRASMAVSLEVRVPFLDHRVVELSARMPLEMKLRGNRGKHVLKRAISSRLPRGVTQRPKKGFGMPVAHWLRGPWRDLLLDTLGNGAAGRSGWLNQTAVDLIIDEHLSGRRDRRKPLWTLLMFRWWEDGLWGPHSTGTS